MGRVIIFLIVAVVCSIQVTGSGASSIVLPTLEEQIDSSVLVGRVRITKGEELSFEWDGERHSCGWVYDATLIEAYKGKLDSFKFVAVYDLVANVGADHLVIMQQRDDAAIDPEILDELYLTPFDKAEMQCRESVTDYFVRYFPKSLVRISSELDGTEFLLSEFDEHRRISGNAISHAIMPHYYAGDQLRYSWADVKARLIKIIQIQDFLVREPTRILERLEDLPIDEQWAIYLYVNGKSYEPIMPEMALPIARQGREAANHIKQQVDDSKRLIDAFHALYVFEVMKKNGFYNVCTDGLLSKWIVAQEQSFELNRYSFNSVDYQEKKKQFRDLCD